MYGEFMNFREKTSTFYWNVESYKDVHFNFATSGQVKKIAHNALTLAKWDQ